jgi:uncharacterized protein
MCLMLSFDDIEVRRPKLARAYLDLLTAQPGRPIALFAPRRVGKTHFLMHDLIPEAKRAKLLPVYADLWLDRADPLGAIIHALEEALDDQTVPSTAVGKIAKTPVKKLGGVEFGEAPARRALPTRPAMRLDALVARLAAHRVQPILLMLDEVQALAEVGDGVAVMSSLRAVLQKYQGKIRAVFTGSSQEALAAMVVAAGGPMYQFAQLIDFPVLGDEYLEALANHFASVHSTKRLALGELRRCFQRIGHKPALMKDIVKSMSAEGITDVDLALKRHVADARQIRGWQGILEGVSPLEQHLLRVVAQGEPPLGLQAVSFLARQTNGHSTIPKIRVALQRLKRAGLLVKPGTRYVVADALFADWLMGRVG